MATIPNLSDFDKRKYDQQEKLLADLENMADTIRKNQSETDRLSSLCRSYLIEAIEDRMISPYRATMATSRLIANEVQQRLTVIKLYDRLAGMIGPAGLPLEEEVIDIDIEIPKDQQRTAEKMVVKMVDYYARKQKEARQRGESLLEFEAEGGSETASG